MMMILFSVCTLLLLDDSVLSAIPVAALQILECSAKYTYLRQTKHQGTYRVDLVVALFARILDLHNFEFVVR